MALLGGAGPAAIAGLCAFAALGYAIYQVNTLFIQHPLLQPSRSTPLDAKPKPLDCCADSLSSATL